MGLTSEEKLPDGVATIEDGDEVVGLWFEEGLVLSDEEQARVSEFLRANDLPPLPEDHI